MKITPETPILFAPEGAGVWSEATLGEFFANNAAALGPEEQARIIADLEAGETCEIQGVDAVFTVAIPEDDFPDVTDHMTAEEKAGWAEFGRLTRKEPR